MTEPALLPRAIGRAVSRSPIPHRLISEEGPQWSLLPTKPWETPSYRIVVHPSVDSSRLEVRSSPLASRYVTALRGAHGEGPAARGALERSLPVGSRIVRFEWELASFSLLIYSGIGDDGLVEESATATLAALLGFLEAGFEIELGLLRPARMRSTEDIDSAEIEARYDTDERDRWTLEHRLCENSLIDWLDEQGVEPMDPVGEVEFDLAWQRHDGAYVVCEVKSLSQHPIKQLRLGTGQVLQYAELLRRRSPRVVWVPTVALSEAPPNADIWVSALEAAGVDLVWPLDDGGWPEAILTGVYVEVD